MLRKIKNRINNYHIIIFCYLAVIFLGAGVLLLPFSVKPDTNLKFLDSLFISTSAVCITGLTYLDIFSTFSLFGQVVLLFLIQIGGIGFMTLITLLTLFLKRKLSLGNKMLFNQSSGTTSLDKVKNLILYIVIGTLALELLGALLLMIEFIPVFGAGRGIYFSVFHSVSAFCNAGIDLMGSIAQFSSLKSFSASPLVLLTVSFLVILGSLGFLVFIDIFKHKFKFSKFSLHSKIVIVFSAFLLVFGTVFFLVFESGHAFRDMSAGKKILNSFFYSATSRTAGFTTVSLSSFSESGKGLYALLMFIGGAPGSTAGGIKVTTFAVLTMSVISSVRREGSITLFKRRLEETASVNAMTIITLFSLIVVVSGVAISMMTDMPIFTSLVECASALTNTGISFGITGSFNNASKLILSFLMLLGRLGMLSLVMLFSSKKPQPQATRPPERIIIG